MDVEVMDPVPLFRQGLLHALELDSGIRTEAEAHPPSKRTAIFLTLSDDESWSVLASLRYRDDAAVIAVMCPFTFSAAARALRGGAVHVVSHAAAPEVFRQTLNEVKQGVISLPAEILLAALSTTQPIKAGLRLEDDEIEWLQSLARGGTVASIAETAALSERALYRRLKQLYRKLGVPNRTRAIMLGHDEGWL